MMFQFHEVQVADFALVKNFILILSAVLSAFASLVGKSGKTVVVKLIINS